MRTALKASNSDDPTRQKKSLRGEPAIYRILWIRAPDKYGQSNQYCGQPEKRELSHVGYSLCG